MDILFPRRHARPHKYRAASISHSDRASRLLDLSVRKAGLCLRTERRRSPWQNIIAANAVMDRPTRADVLYHGASADFDSNAAYASLCTRVESRIQTVRKTSTCLSKTLRFFTWLLRCVVSRVSKVDVLQRGQTSISVSSGMYGISSWCFLRSLDLVETRMIRTTSSKDVRRKT